MGYRIDKSLIYRTNASGTEAALIKAIVLARGVGGGAIKGRERG
jgi:hypothetical protein